MRHSRASSSEYCADQESAALVQSGDPPTQVTQANAKLTANGQ